MGKKIPIFILNLINVGPFDKVIRPGKNPKLITVGPTFILESKVCTHL